MTTYSQVVPEVRRPLATLTLPPSAFNPSWRSAPRVPTTIGITLISTVDVDRGKAMGAREASRLFPNPDDNELRMDAFRDVLVRWCVARGTCDPDNVSAPFDLWREAPEDIVPEALTVEGVKACWDAIDKLATETSPVATELSDEGIASLCELARVALPALPPMREQRVRRLLGACFEELLTVATEA